MKKISKNKKIIFMYLIVRLLKMNIFLVMSIINIMAIEWIRDTMRTLHSRFSGHFSLFFGLISFR